MRSSRFGEWIASFSAIGLIVLSGPRGVCETPLYPPCAQFPAGLSRQAFDRFLAKAKDAETDALIVVKDGCVVHESDSNGDPTEAFSVQSVTKSVASLAIGALLAEHPERSLETTLGELFPEVPMSAEKATVTLRHLLSQTSGLPNWDQADWGGGTDKLAAALRTELIAEPGRQWLYSSLATYLLGPAIERIAGVPADRYLREKIFAPLGISSAAWRPGGADLAGGLFLSARDMLKIGALALNGGAWEGRRVIAPEWIAQAIVPSQALNPPYGFLWWLNGPQANGRFRAFSAMGYQGQYVAVAPGAGLLAVRVHRYEPSMDLARFARVSWLPFVDDLLGTLAP